MTCDFTQILQLLDTRRFSEAVSLIEKLEQGVHGELEWATLRTLKGRALYGVGKFTDAKGCLQEAIDRFPSECAEVKYAKFILARVEADQVDVHSASAHFRDLLDDTELESPEFRDLFWEIRKQWAFFLTNSHRATEAKPLLEDLLLQELAPEERHRIMLYLGVCYQMGSDPSRAHEQYLLVANSGADHELTFEAHYRLALLDYRRGALPSAKFHLQFCENELQSRGTIPKSFVFEMLFRTCLYLNQRNEAQRYRTLAIESGAML